MVDLFKKYRELIAYLIFGVATTAVNIRVYFLSSHLFALDYRISNTISWIVSVLFAFVTNKYFVFLDNAEEKQPFFKELVLFYWYRGLSFIMEMLLMVVLIDYLFLPDLWVKTITQVVVVVLNYFLSKWFVFKKKAV